MQSDYTIRAWEELKFTVIKNSQTVILALSHDGGHGAMSVRQ